MGEPFLAMIIPVSGGTPTHPIAPGGPPPVAGWGPGFPTNPIAPGGQPPRPWGPINYPDQGLPQPPLGMWGPIRYPDQGLPGSQPIPGWGPGFPTNPIAPGGQPPRPWGPINYPDQGLPGNQPIAGWGPGFPTNPIVLPPITPGGPPVYISHPIAPGGERPTHPIVYPPLPPPPDAEGVKPPPEDGGWGYAPGAGWGYFPPQGEAQPK